MNSNRRVLFFVTGSTVLLLFLSLLSEFFHIRQFHAFNNINLVSELFSRDSASAGEPGEDNGPSVTIEAKADEDFTLYNRSRLITDFTADTNIVSLQRFMQKLHDLKAGKKTKVRIAYFGDSMIEGDLLTQTLRQLLQKAFGGSGVGFVPVTSQVSQFRQTVSHTYSDTWTDVNFRTGKSTRLYFSGHLFQTANGWVQMTDNTITDTAALIEKSLLCGRSGNLGIQVNGAPFSLKANDVFNRVPLANNLSRNVRIGISQEQLPVYGVSFESASGIIVDNFSFRGITGIEFSSVDSAFLECIEKANPYDLIVFQYGVNLLFRPNDRNFSWYAKTMLPVIRKFRSCFDHADFLLVSTADRAFRYGSEYKSAVGIDSLVKVQAALAWETHSCFYNQFASMGGTNSIVDWANRKPPMANKDYVHPNHKGAEELARYFYDALMRDFEKYERTIK